MAASGYTPITLYNTGTLGTAPIAGNLVNGELAINYTDGNLYYKDNTGAVQVIANHNAAIGIFNTTGTIQIPAGTTGQRSTGGVTTLGTITGGTGYVNGTYTGVQMSYVSGSTATTYPIATIVVTSGAVFSVTITSAGTGFTSIGTVLTASAALIGGTGSGFSVPVATITPARIRFNTSTNLFEGFNGIIWAPIGGSVAGGAIYENTRTIASNYTITAGNGAESVGPITVSSGYTVIVPATSRWVIL
jgi:hypothetical protein